MTANTPTPDNNVVHEHYCLPQPDADAPRIERYTLPRYGPDGIVTVSEVEVVRCTECGAATYDGVPERYLSAPVTAPQG